MREMFDPESIGVALLAHFCLQMDQTTLAISFSLFSSYLSGATVNDVNFVKIPVNYYYWS